MWLMPGRNPHSVSRLMHPPQMSGLGNRIYFIYIANRTLDAGDRMYRIVQSCPVIHCEMPVGAVRHQHQRETVGHSPFRKIPASRRCRKNIIPRHRSGS